MKRSLALASLVFAAGCAAHRSPASATAAPTATAVASAAASAPTPAGTPYTVLFDDLGSWHHAVTTRSPEAQKFFDQGLRLIYGFNHDEAIRSFREAARLDPDCAMAYWGVAVALGPNYNLPTNPDAEKTAREMIAKARSLESKVASIERDYIEAAAKRYAGEPTPDRHALDQAYADAMRALAKAHPEDPDAATLFAESMMDLRPWMLWDHDGHPAPGTEEIVATLEGVLAKVPDHPGANHYYIHAQEAGPHPEKALDAAKRLPGLMPGAGHLVHMPCHIFIHTAQWADASAANERAIAVDKAYVAKANPPRGAYGMMYVGHNFQFLWATASMEGRSKVALEAAANMVAPWTDDMVRGMEKDVPGIDYLMAPPLIARIRFGHWQEILSMPSPSAEFKFEVAMWHFARGFAFSRLGKKTEARAELAALQSFADSLKPDEMVGPLNSGKATFAVAVKLLGGELAAADGKLDQAIALEREAVAAEDALNYDEPPPWPLPCRHYLGALLLQAKKPAEAIAVYQADLKKFPENGWALFGLSKAYQQGKAFEAKDAEERFHKAWANADVELTASRF